MSVINQRKMDIVQLEAESYIQKVMAEFLRDLMGDRMELGKVEVEDAFTESEAEGEDQLGVEDAGVGYS